MSFNVYIKLLLTIHSSFFDGFKKIKESLFKYTSNELFFVIVTFGNL